MIRTFNDPILSTVCAPVEVGDDLAFLDDMRATCERLKGVGLAAPQIGIAKRVIYIASRGESLFMVNPEITWRSAMEDVQQEGCLSYPGIFTPIARSIGVKVRFFDDCSEQHVRDFAYFAARVIQHEVDHLDGICRGGDAWRAGGRK